VDSISKHGLLHPPTVRPVGEELEVVCGWRRVCASKKAGLIEVPVLVKRLGDVEAMLLGIAENIERGDLSGLEVAKGLGKLMEIGLTPYEIAKKLGKDPSWVYRHLKLMEAEGFFHCPGAMEKLTERHVRVILESPPEARERIVREVEKSIEEKGKPPPVRELEHLAESIGRSKPKPDLGRVEAEKKAEEAGELFKKLEKWHNGGFITLFDLCMPGEKKDLATWREGIKRFEKLLTSFISEKKLVPELKEWCVKHAS
jgi:ParB family chromosome partitioning protein